MANILNDILNLIQDIFSWGILFALFIGLMKEYAEMIKLCSPDDCSDKKIKKQSNGLSKKDRKIIEKYIDDGYKRMKR